MPSPEDELTVYRLQAVQTYQLRGEPRAVIELQAAGGDTMHFSLHLDDLAALGKRLAADAQLMRAVALTGRVSEWAGCARA
jgi:hypothetical protein